jgi:hypothetical protein
MSHALSYAVDGPVVIVRVTGTPTDEERAAVYGAIARDAAVPKPALLLINASRADPSSGSADIRHRAQMLAGVLVPLGTERCALVVPPRLADDAYEFQAAAGELSVEVRLFIDEDSAKRWLRGEEGK